MEDIDPSLAVWLTLCTILVLFMVPGLALFYGGMVRTKNLLNMLMMNMFCLGIVPLVWVIVGFSLISGGGSGGNGILGGFDLALLDGMENDGEALLWCMYALVFAVITPALISGAVADRIKFPAWAVFVPLWVLLVYVPIGNWVWALPVTDDAGQVIEKGGWLLERGSLDFAGGLVVHINAGAAALVFALLLGKRRGWPGEAMKPHNLTLTMLGAGILWFGWFGFNAGIAGPTGVAGIAVYNTLMAAAAGLIGWLIVETIKDGKPTSLGAASGIVAGLVAVTPCAGFVSGLSPIFIGLAAGIVCYLAVSLKYKFGYDDSLDVVGVHFAGGLVGTLLLGLFANKDAYPAVADAPGGGGLFYGGTAELLMEQAIAAAVVIVFSGVMTFLIVKAIDLTIGIRVSEDDEAIGLDQSQHAETAYNLT